MCISWWVACNFFLVSKDEKNDCITGEVISSKPSDDAIMPISTGFATGVREGEKVRVPLAKDELVPVATPGGAN